MDALPLIAVAVIGFLGWLLGIKTEKGRANKRSKLARWRKAKIERGMKEAKDDEIYDVLIDRRDRF